MSKKDENKEVNTSKKVDTSKEVDTTKEKNKKKKEKEFSQKCRRVLMLWHWLLKENNWIQKNWLIKWKNGM